MKEDSLRRHLKQLTVPAASESARSRARHRALIAFQQVGSSSPEPSAGRFAWRWVWVSALVGIVAISFFYHRPRAATENLANDRQMLRQMEMLFPGQVDSVVEQNGKVDVSVAQSSLVGSQQPVVMVFRKDAQSIHVLSYSGHHVCVLLGKERRCFDVLATPTGSVILESDDKVWVTSQPVVVGGYSVQAQTLEASL